MLSSCNNILFETGFGCLSCSSKATGFQTCFIQVILPAQSASVAVDQNCHNNFMIYNLLSLNGTRNNFLLVNKLSRSQYISI